MTPCCWSIPSNSFGTTEQIRLPLQHHTMKTERTPSFLKTFLSQNPRFVGFGNLSASTLILSDGFLVDPSSDELEVMFQLEKVGATWMEKLTDETSEAGELKFVPAYANHYMQSLSEGHSLPSRQKPIFYMPLAGDHLYFENRAVWIMTLRERLQTYQGLIQSFSNVYYRSSYLSIQEIEEILQLKLAGSDH